VIDYNPQSENSKNGASFESRSAKLVHYHCLCWDFCLPQWCSCSVWFYCGFHPLSLNPLLWRNLQLL